MMADRKKYYLCRYRRTDEVKDGNGFHNSDVKLISLIPIAPSFIYELYRDGGPLFLTEDEAKRIDEGLSEEGCPHLLPEDQAIEGKKL